MNQKGNIVNTNLILVPNILALLVFIIYGAACQDKNSPSENKVRIALFNIWELSTKKLLNVDEFGVGKDNQLQAAAEIVRHLNPDVLVVNEIDHDVGALLKGKDLTLNARRFNDAYLKQGEKYLDYKYIFAAPCNTGFLAGKDLDNNGKIETEEDIGNRDYGGDCYGYGGY